MFENNKNLKSLRYVSLILKNKFKYIFILSLISLFVVVVNISKTHIMADMIDSVSSSEITKIVQLFIMYLSLIIVTFLLLYSLGLLQTRLYCKILSEQKKSIAKIILSGRYKDISRMKTGDTLVTVNSDTQQVSKFLSTGWNSLFSQLVMAVGTVIYMFAISPKLVFAVLIYLPIGLLSTFQINKRLKELYPKRVALFGEVLSVLEQFLIQLPLIKSLMMNRYIHVKVDNGYRDVFTMNMKIALPNAILQTACGMTAGVPRIFFLLMAAFMYFQNDISIGQLIALLELIGFLIGPMVALPFLLNDANRSMASVNRLMRIKSISKMEKDRVQTDNELYLKIDSVTFGYNAGNTILKDFSFYHNGPGLITIVGMSGSGKTTLLDLISGLYSPLSGKIKAGCGISYMSQDSYMFSDTIFNNVKMSNSSASNDEVYDVLEKSGCEMFIDSMPDGYHSKLGDNGNEISGGQMQRISLSRVLLQNTPILLLDEPTSSLDNETERKILALIKELSQIKLVVISTHKDSIIQTADKIIQLGAKQ